MEQLFEEKNDVYPDFISDCEEVSKFWSAAAGVCSTANTCFARVKMVSGVTVGWEFSNQVHTPHCFFLRNVFHTCGTSVNEILSGVNTRSLFRMVMKVQINEIKQGSCVSHFGLRFVVHL